MSRFEEQSEPHFLETTTVTVERMLVLSGLSRDELIELVEHGAFGPSFHDKVIEQWQFAGRAALLARRAVSLQRTFELDVDATSLVMGLLERMEEMQQRIRELECHLNV